MNRPVRTGALRTRIVLEAPVEVADDIGGVTRGYVPVATLWASVDVVRGLEGLRDGGQRQVRRSRVVIRWRAGLTAAMRFRIGARALDIRMVVDPGERHRFWICDCEETSP